MLLKDFYRFTEAEIASGEAVFVTQLDDSTARIESIPMTSRQFSHGDVVRIVSRNDSRPMITDVIKPSGHKTAAIRLDWQNPGFNRLLKSFEEKGVVSHEDIDLTAISAPADQLLELLRQLESPGWSHLLVHNNSPLKPASEGMRGYLDMTYFARLWISEMDLAVNYQDL